MDSEFEENYQKFKEKKKLIQSTKKGKLTPFKELIERMIDDGFFQTDIKEHLEEQYNVKVSINSLFLFIKKLKDKKAIEMELINGTNFVAAPIAQDKEKKSKPKTIPNSTIHKSIPKETIREPNDAKKGSDIENNKQTIDKKLVLNLPIRKIKTGEIVQVDRSQFK